MLGNIGTLLLKSLYLKRASRSLAKTGFKSSGSVRVEPLFSRIKDSESGIASETHSGVVLGYLLGAFWEPLGALWAPWGPFGCLWVPLGLLWCASGVLWGASG